MPISLRVRIPDHLRAIFERRSTLVVNDDGVASRRALVVWLWGKGGLWISRRPALARRCVEDLLAAYPRLPLGRVKFVGPRDVGYEDVDHCVIEEPDSIPEAVAWAKVHVLKELRILKTTVETKVAEDIRLTGMSLNERKELLKTVRAGDTQEYDEYALVASICRESFFEFVKEFWGEVVPEAYVDNWHVRYMCDEIQTVLERVFRNEPKKHDLIINVSPGSTKSLILSVMSQPWAWTHMPSFRYIGGSYANTLAMDLSRKSRQVVRSAKYQMTFPIKLSEDQNAKSYYVNDAGGCRIGIGTGGIAGFHAHCLGIDDPLDPNKALSEVEIAAANTWLEQGISQRKVDQNVTPMILIMQRLHHNDCTAFMLERTTDVRHVCIPAELTDDVKPKELREFYVNNLMDPTRLPMKVLEAKMKLGRYMYAGQYLQTPTPLTGGMFLWENVRYEPVPKSFDMVVRYWDKAGTEEDGCYTVGVKMGIVRQPFHVWVINVVRGQWDSGRREKIIKSVTQEDGPDVIVGVEQEPGSGGLESAKNTVRNLAGFHVILDRPTGDKILRADAYSTSVNNGDVSLVVGVWNMDYLDEMRYFGPNCKYKDQIDASTGAYKLLTTGSLRVGGGW